MDKGTEINIKRQVRVCNEAMLDTLVRFKKAGMSDDDIKFLLNFIGKAYCQLSIEDRSIDSSIERIINALENCEY